MPKELTNEEFQSKVITGVEAVEKEVGAVKTKQEELLTNYANLDKATKKAFEDFDKLKKVANDTDANFKSATKAIENIQAQMRNEVRMAFGNPIQRVAQNEDLRRTLGALVARSLVDVSKGEKLPSFHEDALKRALGEDSSPGSTTIISQLYREMYDTLATYGVWSTFGVRRLGTKTTQFPVKTARPVANYLTSEAATISDDSSKAGTSVTLTVLPIAVLLNISLQLLEDSQFDITSDVMGDFAEAAALRLDDSILNADGTSNGSFGGFTGIFGGGGTASVAASTHTTVATTTLEDWTAVLNAVDPAVLSRAARWWMHPNQIVRALSVKDLNGRPLFLNALDAPSNGAIGSILGYPVTSAFAAPNTNTTNSKIAAFGDPNAMVVGIRRDFGFDSSDHFRWNTLERSFRAYLREAHAMRRATGISYLKLAAS